MPINSFDHYPMSWKPDLSHAKPPLYKALAKQLEESIQSGHLQPGDLLPPQRELADFLDLNLSTITKAFKLCTQKGLISATTGKGTYVASDVHENITLLAPQKVVGLINMGAICPTSEFNGLIQKGMINFIKSKQATRFLEYNLPSGTPYQKQTGVKWLQLARLNTSPDQILLANGGQNSLCAILVSLFQSGDKIGTDPLVYSGIKSLAKMLGIQLIPIPQENHEMSATALEQYCKNEGLKGIYLIPDYQNPTTYTMSLNTRKALAKVAKKYHLIVIEDAINALFSPNPLPPIASLLPKQTLYVSSLSKVLCPGMQMAFIYTPLDYKEILENGLYNTNVMVCPLNAEMACALIHSTSCKTILTERRTSTIQRNQIVNDILGDYELVGDSLCSFRFLPLPNGWTGKDFEKRAQLAGVQVYSCERFAVGSSPVPLSVRLAITTPSTLEELEKGLFIIKKLLEHSPASPTFITECK